jgi:polyvinyl alcohol dehydrogenase (cytochrome)
LLLATTAASMFVAGADPAASTALPGSDWISYLGGQGAQGFTGETVITSQNASRLRLAAGWPQKAGSMSTQPVVANDLVYWGTSDGEEIAVPAVGAKGGGWRAKLGTTDAGPCGSGGVSSTAAMASVTLPHESAPTSLLFVGGGGTDAIGGGQAKLYALDALTGAIVWQAPLGAAPATYIWSSPVVYTYSGAGGSLTSVYVGVSSFGDCPLVQGKVVQLDAATGRIQHTFDVVPDGCTGGSVWGSPTIDAGNGLLYVATGNPGTCATPEKGAPALIELNAADLSLVDEWQLPEADQVVDSDFGSTPTLFSGTVTPDGSSRPLVGVANKNGVYYVFDRRRIGAGPVARLRIAIPGDSPALGEGSISPSAFDGSTLYVAGGATTIQGVRHKGSVGAWNPNDLSTPLWQDGLPGPVLAAVTAAPGIIAVGAGTNTFVLRSQDGLVLFTAADSGATTTRPAPFWGAPSIAHGTLYEGAADGYVYAYTNLLALRKIRFPTSVLGRRFRAKLNAVGGTGPYRWTRVAGSLPPGLEILPTGVLRGQPRVAGKYRLFVRLEDSGDPAQNITTSYRLTVKR